MKKSILFVDDDSNVLSGLQRMLRTMRAEWDMVFTESGSKALEEMARQPFDVIVSDMRMPGMNGAELLREAMRLSPATVRIVLSGHADRDLVNQCVGVAHQYISKPCDPEQLKSLIQNATLISGRLVDDKVKRILGSIERLPSAPRLYTALVEALKVEDITMQSIETIIQQDMGMTAKILQLVNSSFFGLRRRIESTHEAVAFLGVDTIKGLVLANGIFEFAQPLAIETFTLDDLWSHSLRVAEGAKRLAIDEGLSRPLQEEAFVGGVLHDLGVLVLVTNFPNSYERVARIVQAEEISIPTAEQWEFGVTHAEVGAYLLGLWGIPSSILRIVSLHHHPGLIQGSTFSPLLAVHLANVFGDPAGSHPMFGHSSLDAEIAKDPQFTPHLDRWRARLAENLPQ